MLRSPVRSRFNDLVVGATGVAILFIGFAGTVVPFTSAARWLTPIQVGAALFGAIVGFLMIAHGSYHPPSMTGSAPRARKGSIQAAEVTSHSGYTYPTP
jgi:hypothetical protein